jgi:transcriptional regulator with XRE-family HTH domain
MDRLTRVDAAWLRKLADTRLWPTGKVAKAAGISERQAERWLSGAQRFVQREHALRFIAELSKTPLRIPLDDLPEGPEGEPRPFPDLDHDPRRHSRASPGVDQAVEDLIDDIQARALSRWDSHRPQEIA